MPGFGKYKLRAILDAAHTKVREESCFVIIHEQTNCYEDAQIAKQTLSIGSCKTLENNARECESGSLRYSRETISRGSTPSTFEDRGEEDSRG